MNQCQNTTQLSPSVCFTTILALPVSATNETKPYRALPDNRLQLFANLRLSLDSLPWPLPTEPTPLTPISFRGHTVFIKRDDQLEFAGISGSKLRKFYSLFNDSAFGEADHLVSYGGAQSNAMLALAKLCHFHRKPFLYITRPISPRLSKTPGNFRDALSANMFHIQVNLDDYRSTFTDVPPDTIEQEIHRVLHSNNSSIPFPTARPYFIPQGGAWPGAEPGIKILASEFADQISALRKSGKLTLKKPIMFLACGTGTTAFFLQKHLKDVARVVAIPVSGSEIYLIKQMRWLNKVSTTGTLSMETLSIPDVLRPRLRASFADIRSEKLHIWEELRRATNGHFDFDLVYAPKAWEEVSMAIEQGRVASNGEDLLYYHSGGVEGNISMLGKFIDVRFSRLHDAECTAIMRLTSL